MIRDLAFALLLLALVSAPLAPAVADAMPVCTRNGVVLLDADGKPVRPVMPDPSGCAHMLCPSRERRP